MLHIEIIEQLSMITTTFICSNTIAWYAVTLLLLVFSFQYVRKVYFLRQNVKNNRSSL